MATALTQTTLSAALSITANTLNVASATGITAPVANVNQQIYVIGPGQKRGELMFVIGVSSNAIQVQRLDQFKAFWPSGSLVIIGPAPSASTLAGGQFFGGAFQEYDPVGSNASPSSNSANSILYTPWINVNTGNQWIWSTVVGAWVPGWGNDAEKVPTAAVASTAGLITPSGPLFHVTGTAAITGITLPVGFSYGSFTIIADAVFSWTAANNIAATSANALLGSTSGVVVVGKAYTFVYDPATAKFYILGA